MCYNKHVGNTRKRKKSIKRKKFIVLIAVVAIVLVVVILANQDYGFMSDQRKAKEFEPYPEIDALVSKMTYKRVFDGQF